MFVDVSNIASEATIRDLLGFSLGADEVDGVICEDGVVRELRPVSHAELLVLGRAVCAKEVELNFFYYWTWLCEKVCQLEIRGVDGDELNVRFILPGLPPGQPLSSAGTWTS